MIVCHEEIFIMWIIDVKRIIFIVRNTTYRPVNITSVIPILNFTATFHLEKDRKSVWALFEDGTNDYKTIFERHHS